MKNQSDIEKIIEEYFQKFDKSQEAMAASLESLAFCKDLIDTTNCNTILDSGSGLSSIYMHYHYDDVTTIDDNELWGHITADFIKTKLNKKISIGTIEKVEQKKYDFVFYDYGGIEARIFHFKKALELCGRFMYVDDIHIGFYRSYIESRARGYGIEFIPQSLDKYGRYGAIITVNGRK